MGVTLKSIGLFLIASTLCYFVWDYVQMGKEIGELNGTITKWTIEYTQAVGAQKESEAAMQQLKAEQAKIEKEVVDWKNKYAAIQNKQRNAQQLITKLEAQYEDIRIILHQRVPDELWRVLFPQTTGNPGGNQNGKSANTGIVGAKN